jgi:hypothetical protein
LPDLIVGSCIDMRLFARIVAMFLALSLMGGAQACSAICAQPVARVAAGEVKTCPHCLPRGAKKSSTPPSDLPCKLCEGAVQHRVADEGVSPFSFSLDLAWLGALPAMQGTALFEVEFAAPPLPTHKPPGDLLHQFCILLI